MAKYYAREQHQSIPSVRQWLVYDKHGNYVGLVVGDEQAVKALTEPATEKYTENVLRLESPYFADDLTEQEKRILHASMGLSNEAGELAGPVKARLFYNRPLDYTNLKEEAGDICWYLALLCDALGLSLEEVMDANIRKLAARYPEKFSKERANNRDLATERKALEGTANGNAGTDS